MLLLILLFQTEQIELKGCCS